jgi:uncharacterized protein (DUF433 family)
LGRRRELRGEQFEYLESGETLDEFLRQFPSVNRDQAIAALDLARATLLAGARSS